MFTQLAFTFGGLDRDMGTRLEPREQGFEQLPFTLETAQWGPEGWFQDKDGSEGQKGTAPHAEGAWCSARGAGQPPAWSPAVLA